MPVRSWNCWKVPFGFFLGSMYCGQFEMISFLSVAETSFAVHDNGSCSAPSVLKNGSFSAARLTPAKAAAPPPLSRPRRDSAARWTDDSCAMRLPPRDRPDGSDRATIGDVEQAIQSIRNTLATK